MVTSPTCPNCRAWEIEVGSIYHKTAESRLAPLRRIDIANLERANYYRFAEPVLYTPTFILLHRDREIGRIVGYADEAMFWGLFNELLAKLRPTEPAPIRNSRNVEPAFQ